MSPHTHPAGTVMLFLSAACNVTRIGDRVHMCWMFSVVVVCSGVTSLSTIFQSYHDGVSMATGSSVVTFIVLPH